MYSATKISKDGLNVHMATKRLNVKSAIPVSMVTASTDALSVNAAFTIFGRSLARNVEKDISVPTKSRRHFA